MGKIESIHLNKMSRKAYKDFFERILYPIDESYKLIPALRGERDEIIVIMEFENSNVKREILRIHGPIESIVTAFKSMFKYGDDKKWFKALWK